MKRPIMVHRAILGSMERFVGTLIEHFGGKFPFWCAPTQIALIPIREQHAEYCKGLERELEQDLFRVQAMLDPGHMKAKIKTAEHEKVPFMLIAGDREAAERTVTVRRRHTQEQETVPFEKFLELARRLRTERSLALA